MDGLPTAHAANCGERGLKTAFFNEAIILDMT